MSDQRTLEESGLPELLGRMVKDAAMKYRGGVAKLDLIKGHPEFVSQTHELWDRLAAEQAIRMPLLERPPFATITVGNFASVTDLKQALNNGGYRIGNWANDLLGRPKFHLVAEPAKLDLYRASNAELGYPNGCTVAQSFEALEKIGAVKLPPEAGAQFRLQYPGQQPLGEWCLTYMDPIAGSDGDLGVFGVGHDDGGLWLGSSCASPGGFYGGGEVWVFARK